MQFLSCHERSTHFLAAHYVLSGVLQLLPAGGVHAEQAQSLQG